MVKFEGLLGVGSEGELVGSEGVVCTGMVVVSDCCSVVTGHRGILPLLVLGENTGGVRPGSLPTGSAWEEKMKQE